jgi:predicted Fe-Mo cluster-binding NifX family protein
MREQDIVQVKIVEFSAFCKGKGERALEALINQGWRIVAAGGAGTFPNYIVILQRSAQQHSVGAEAGFAEGDYLT